MKDLVLQNWPLILFGVVGVVLVVLALVSLRDGPLPYERQGVLLSPAEVSFLRSLHRLASVAPSGRGSPVWPIPARRSRTMFWTGSRR